MPHCPKCGVPLRDRAFRFLMICPRCKQPFQEDDDSGGAGVREPTGPKVPRLPTDIRIEVRKT